MTRKSLTPVLEKPAAKTTTAARPANRSALKKTSPVSDSPRVAPESVLAAGRLWKMSGRHGVAYVQDPALAGELLAIDPKNLARAAMAVYYDKKGRAFAWQVRFDTERWEDLMKRLG